MSAQQTLLVIPALVAGIQSNNTHQEFLPWIPGMNPGMTVEFHQ
jgi:hypothetical protein